MYEPFWYVVYILGFFGSVSFGYLALRFGIPDVRGVPRQAKLGLAGIAGIMFFSISFAIAYVFPEAPIFVILPILAFFTAMIFEIRNRFLSPKTLKVAIPVARVETPVPVEQPVKRAPKKYKREVLATKVLEGEELIAAKPTEYYPAKHPAEISAEKEKADIKRAREERTISRKQERKKAVERRKEEKEKPGFLSRHRRRYLEHRGELMKQVRTDLSRAKTVSPKIKIKEKVLSREELEKPFILEGEPSLESLSQGLSLDDLESLGSTTELEELGLEGLGDLELDLATLAGVSETEKVTKEKGMGCPHCQASKATIVYCPYCGKGFCADCSTKVESKQGMTFYQCPICSKEVIVKASK